MLRGGGSHGDCRVGRHGRLRRDIHGGEHSDGSRDQLGAGGDKRRSGRGRDGDHHGGDCQRTVRKAHGDAGRSQQADDLRD